MARPSRFRFLFLLLIGFASAAPVASAATLADVYTAGGEVLMGTLRQQQEAAEQQEKERMRSQMARRQRELELAEAEVQARIEALKKELVAHQEEQAILLTEREAMEQRWWEEQRTRRRLRGADEETQVEPPAERMASWVDVEAGGEVSS